MATKEKKITKKVSAYSVGVHSFAFGTNKVLKFGEEVTEKKYGKKQIEVWLKAGLIK